MTQQQFADFLMISVRTLQKWEQGERLTADCMNNMNFWILDVDLQLWQSLAVIEATLRSAHVGHKNPVRRVFIPQLYNRWRIAAGGRAHLGQPGTIVIS
jgi:transcriptional regulator with XRE-family HTH domain